MIWGTEAVGVVLGFPVAGVLDVVKEKRIGSRVGGVVLLGGIFEDISWTFAEEKEVDL